MTKLSIESVEAYLLRDKTMDAIAELPPTKKRKQLRAARLIYLVNALNDIRDKERCSLPEACRLYIDKRHDYPMVQLIDKELGPAYHTAKSLYDAAWLMEQNLVETMLNL